MVKSITGTITLALTVAFAIPVGLFGLNFLFSGRQFLGGVFVALAVLMVVFEEYVTTPGDIPGMAARRVTSAIVKTDDETEQSERRNKGD